MTLHAVDMQAERPRRKYRSQIHMTKELFKGWLGIPDNVEVLSIFWDPTRETLRIILEGQELSPFMFEVGEGQEIPMIAPTEWFEEAAIRRFRNITNNAEAVQLLREEDEDA